MDRDQEGRPTEDMTGTASRKPREPRVQSARRRETRRNGQGEAMSLASSAALIGLGALLQPQLLVGMAIGAGIVIASRRLALPDRDLVRPLLKATIKAAYAAAATTEEMMAEVSEQLRDIAAEASAERKAAASVDRRLKVAEKSN